MRINLIYYFFFILLFYGCNHFPNEEQNVEVNSNSTVIIKKPFQNNPELIEYEFSVLKGTTIKQGIQRRYYMHGSIYSEIPYINGKREGIAYTYYPVVAGSEPVVWKEQPYKNDVLNGICKRYHENGVLQAEYEYKNGLQAIGLKEYYQSGNPVNLPDLVISYKKLEDYYLISAHLASDEKNVDYYNGSLVEGKYFPENLKRFQIRNGFGEGLISLEKKSATITATFYTRYQNKVIISKTIKLQ